MQPEDPAQPVAQVQILWFVEDDGTPRTALSLTDPDEIMNRIGETRTQGFAVIDQEVEIGLRSLAVPVYDSRDRVVAALNTGMAAAQASLDDLVAIYLPALLKVQSGVRRVLH